MIVIRLSQAMHARLFYSVLITGLVVATVTRSDEPQGSAEPRPEREPGVRLRVFQIEAPLNRMPRLAPDQSPNLDRTISSLSLGRDEFPENEPPRNCIAILTTELHLDHAEDYQFQLVSNCLATLRMAGKDAITDSRSKHGVTTTVGLVEGANRVELIVAVNNEAPQVDVRWSPDSNTEFAPIPTEVLSAEAFYFRPTSPGLKQIVATHHRPGRHRKINGVYPSLDLETIRPADVEIPVGGLACLADGTLVVATFDARKMKAPRPQKEPDGELWLYHGAGGDPKKIRRERIATDLYEPSGVCVVGDAIYVSQRLEVTRFDKQPESNRWQATTVASGWESNDFHALSFGLLHEPGFNGHPGYLYMAKGTGLGLGLNPPNHGSVWRIDLSLPADDNVEAITGGHRTPNGLGWGPDRTIYVTDNQGEYTPANELNLVREGAFYGFFHRTREGASPSPFQPDRTRHDNPRAVTEAAAWLPQDEIANSPSQPLMIDEEWPFRGQMLVGDVKYGGLNRVFLEQVAGTWQGAAFRFTQGCEGGINRMAFGIEGELYVGAIGGDHASTWNWVDPTGRKTYHGLQRFTTNGRTTFDFEHIKAFPGGFEIRFTKPVDSNWLGNASNYEVRQWTYQATRGYGGPKVDEERLEITEAIPSADGLSVLLEVKGLKSDRVVHFLVDPTSLEGEEIWSAEAWYTLRRLPTAQQQDSTANSVKHVVFVTGDDEYASELSMPMIASVLERQPNFRVTVLKSVDERGELDRHGHSIPGLRTLREADAAVFFLRFRALPQYQMREIERYIASGRPVIGLRTSSHAFRYPGGPFQRLNDGFGNDILGQQWISHYGHRTTSKAKVIAQQELHPILRGIPEQFELRSWLYVTNDQLHPLPLDCSVLVNGRAIRKVKDVEQVFGKQQPLAWTRELSHADRPEQRIFYTSLGHPHDFLELPSRRLLLNAIYWAVGREDKIPAGGVQAPLPSGYDPPNPQ